MNKKLVFVFGWIFLVLAVLGLMFSRQIYRRVDSWLKKVEAGKDDYGFNALTMEFGSMLKQGILDPAKVTRSALQNAASVATMVLTTECLVTTLPEPKEPAPAGGMPSMGGMGM